MSHVRTRSLLAALLGVGTLCACAARKVAPEVLDRRDASPELVLPAGARPANVATPSSDTDGGSDCGGLDIETRVTRDARASLLLIFDQSGSMQAGWTSTTKIEAAKAAVIAAVEPVAEQLTVGALFLPTQACSPIPPEGGAVAPIGAAEQIAFAAGSEFLKAWRASGLPIPTAADRAHR